MSIRLSQIDQLTLPDHAHLGPEDACFYLGEYTPRAGFAYSQTNDLINNLKKPMDRKELPEWRYKKWAIEHSAKMLMEALTERWFSEVTFVPMPPSKRSDHPEYDDRIVEILRKVGAGRTIDIRELVVMTDSIEAAHLSDYRRSPRELTQVMTFVESLSNPPPTALCIFDDVLTDGAHFKAVQTILRASLPRTPIAGLFLARRVRGELPT